jgi:hypothetical protein
MEAAFTAGEVIEAIGHAPNRITAGDAEPACGVGVLAYPPGVGRRPAPHARSVSARQQ